jgi:hypothetical protein
LLFDLTKLPAGLHSNSVTCQIANIAGRRALRVQLTEDIARNGKPDVHYVDMPTFAVLPVTFETGTLSVDIYSRLNATAPPYARAFAGLAYHIADDLSAFESVYLRPLNGASLNPPPPRDRRAVQYFSYPSWRYERLRETYPDGRHEAAADIVPERWTNLRIEIAATHLRAFVDGQNVLSLNELKADAVPGSVGLFVDIGTEAFFSHLRVESY